VVVAEFQVVNIVGVLGKTRESSGFARDSRRILSTECSSSTKYTPYGINPLAAAAEFELCQYSISTPPRQKLLSHILSFPAPS
jgi:hypothetical protein